MRWGLGPVFYYEWLTASRRWQMYAGRALFVGILLIGLALTWFSAANESRGPLDLRALARLGEGFFYAIIGTQLALVLLAAPAATAGSICLDKARGGLVHLLITELSDAEIILGKLAGRLVPVLGMIAASLPVLFLGILLGGIDPQALLGAYLVTFGVAVLGCTLALTLSIWCAKSYEVLLTVSLIVILAMLAGPIGSLATLSWKVPAPSWLWMMNPFVVAFAPYYSPGTSDLTEPLEFLTAALGTSAALILLAVLTVRRETVRQAGRQPRQTQAHWGAKRLQRWLPGPSLDRNPVLWREWHRKRPSRWVRFAWLIYIVMAGFFGVAAMLLARQKTLPAMAAMVNALQVGVGLLLISMGSVTSLAEDRAHGSLDLLLATPLPSRAIFWGKWWSAFRAVPLLAAWSALIAAVACAGNQWGGAVLIAALVLASGAAITSLGLMLATWVAQLGRALAMSIMSYVGVSIGWVFIVAMLARNEWGEGLACASPFFCVAVLTEAMERTIAFRQPTIMPFAAIWTLAYAFASAAVIWLTLRNFDRRLGRVTGGKRRRVRPSPYAGPHFRDAMVSTGRHA
jgi:ABC-type transport system involved in multi-copper enzyme maturation permease subunit